MARKSTKARIEGSQATSGRPSRNRNIAIENKAALDGPMVAPFAQLANPVPGDDGEALMRIGDYFIATYPEEWENIRLCPLQHGIPAMADILRGRG